MKISLMAIIVSIILFQSKKIMQPKLEQIMLMSPKLDSDLGTKTQKNQMAWEPKWGSIWFLDCPVGANWQVWLKEKIPKSHKNPHDNEFWSGSQSSCDASLFRAYLVIWFRKGGPLLKFNLYKKVGTFVEDLWSFEHILIFKKNHIKI